MRLRQIFLLILGMSLADLLSAQSESGLRKDTISELWTISPDFFDKISSRTSKIETKLDKHTEKTLRRFKKQEAQLERKLTKKDSLAAHKLFSAGRDIYSELEEKLLSAQKTGNQNNLNYFPYVDSLKNALRFFEDDGKKIIKESGDLQNKIGDALGKVTSLESKMNKANVVQQFLKERRQYLKEQVSKYGLARHMKKMNKEVFYYSQALKEYKTILKHPKKIEAKAFILLQKNQAFKKFMNNNSQFSSIFGNPSASGNNSSNLISFTGLQSRASTQQVLQNIPVGSSNPQQFLTEQLEGAIQQLSQQKNSIRFPDLQENLGEIPDFKPNSQKTKSFFKRLEYGANIQFGKANQYLPSTGDLAVSVGYKLNDNGSIGIGSSYKLGLGSSIKQIKFSHQGFGIRSYIDWKIKKGFFISGGFEKNYLPQLNGLATTQKPDTWQESGLIGISKKYPLNKRKGFVQLLFDFLSYKNLPRSQPILFRTGINF